MKSLMLLTALLTSAAAHGMTVDLLRQDPHTKDAQGNTPLHLELVKERPDLDVIGSLLSRKADANAANRAGDTPLHVLLKKADSQENRGLIAYLLRGGACSDAKALIQAAGNEAIHKLLTAQESLFEAIDHHDSEKALELIRTGAINRFALTKEGDTALHRAAWAGEQLADVIEQLLWEGCDPKAVNDSGKSVLQKAIDRAACWALIRNNGVKKNDEPETYFVTWLRKRLDNPYMPVLTFIEPYKGEVKEVTYLSPKWKKQTSQNPLALRSQIFMAIKDLPRN